MSAASRPTTARGEQARRRVLDAAADLLEQGGLGATTVDAVAAGSGVSKATIYKYWPNRLCVAVDAFADRLGHDAAMPEAGSVREALTDQARRVAAFYSSPVGRTYVELMAACLGDPDAAALMRERLLGSRREAVRVFWDHAVERGQVRADLDPDVALDVAFGPVMWRVLRGGEVTADDAAALVAAALDGLGV